MTEKKEDIKKEQSVEDKLVATHPKFLETIREVYPLAVLGSLCIAISAFTQQDFPQAQVYAITGASLFLIAFVFSFATKIFPTQIFVVISYVSTALAVLMLFLVTLEFSKTISMVNKAMSSVIVMVVVVFFATYCYVLGRAASKTRNRFARLSFLVSIVSTMVFIAMTLFLVATAILEVKILPEQYFVYLWFPSLFISLIFFLIGLFLLYKGRKRAKSSNGQSK